MAARANILNIFLRIKPFYCNCWAAGQTVTSLSREGRYQLGQEGRGREPRNRALEGKVSKEVFISVFF